MRVLFCYEVLDENLIKSFLKSFKKYQDLNLIVFKLNNFYKQNNLEVILAEEDKLTEQVGKADVILFECSKSKDTFPILYKQIVKYDSKLILLTHQEGEGSRIISDKPLIKQVRYSKESVQDVIDTIFEV